MYKMLYIRSRKFCCCLPVRFGVFISTLLGTIGGIAIAVALWIEIKRNGTFETGSNPDKLAAGLNAGAWTLLGVVSLFGFVGTIARRTSLVNLYASLLLLTLILTIATGALYIFALFQGETRERAIETCIDKLDELYLEDDSKDDKEHNCEDAYDIARVVSVVVFSFVWLMLLYGYLIAKNYVMQLREEEAAKTAYSPKPMQAHSVAHALEPMPIAPTPQGNAPVHNAQEVQPLAAHDHNEYQYSAPQHSFGTNYAQ